MAKEEEKDKKLWMRYVDFRRVRDLLSIIVENNGKLRAGELEQSAIDTGVLLRDDGRPLAHSPRYHYRRVIEHLGLAAKIKTYYYVSDDRKIKKLLEHAKLKTALSDEEAETFAEFVINNVDSRRSYFDHFIDEDSYTLQIFRERAKWLKVETKGEMGVEFLDNEGKTVASLNDKVQLHAIYWGVRLWSLELGITDELLIHYKDGRIIYPVRARRPVTEDELLLHLSSVGKPKPDQEWVTISMPELVKEVALSKRVPVLEIKNGVERIKRRFPEFVEFIFSSSVFIDVKTPFASQDKVLFKSYLQDKEGRFISHIKIHKTMFDGFYKKIGGCYGQPSE